eukprot:7286291-Heterocapsa_arctica.AAC.1
MFVTVYNPRALSARNVRAARDRTEQGLTEEGNALGTIRHAGTFQNIGTSVPITNANVTDMDVVRVS